MAEKEVSKDVEISPAAPVQIVTTEASAPAKQPFPWRILIVLYLVVISDAMAGQIILCQERWGIALENVGFAAGFLFGAYSFAAFLTSFIIGYVSDTIGRKKLMLIGLVTGALCTAGVVLVPSYWMAVGLRLFAGATNSNIALSRAIIADVTSGENRAIGFAYLGAAFSFSRLVASIIGGMLEGRYLPIGFIAHNPYALPSLVGTIFNLLSFVMAVFFVPETLSKTTKKAKASLREGIKYIARDGVLRNLILGFALNSVTNGAVLSFMMTECQIGSLILALYVYYTLSLDKHSLGFTPQEMGLTFAWCTMKVKRLGLITLRFGLMALLFQTLLFERLLRSLKIVRLYGMGLSVMAISTFVIPSGGLIYWWLGKNSLSTILAYAHTMICFSGLAVGFMTCLPVMGTMISNATDAEQQGLTQGTNQSIAALFRALGPLVAGSIFSFSLSFDFPYLLFWFLGIVNIMCLALLRMLPPSAIPRVSEERPSTQEMLLLPQADSEKEPNEANGGSDHRDEAEVEILRDREVASNGSDHKTKADS